MTHLPEEEAALAWVPCGSHPIREPENCTYCAIDALSDLIRKQDAEIAAYKDQNERIADMRIEDCERAEKAEAELVERTKQMEAHLLAQCDEKNRAEKAEAELAESKLEWNKERERVEDLEAELEQAKPGDAGEGR